MYKARTYSFSLVVHAYFLQSNNFTGLYFPGHVNLAAKTYSTSN